MPSVNREDKAIIGVHPSQFAARAAEIRARLRGAEPRPVALIEAAVAESSLVAPTPPLVPLLEPPPIEETPDEPAFKVPRVVDIQMAVADVFGVSHLDMVSARRTADVVRPRQIAMSLCKRLTLRSLPEIGRRFGGRDHTTALHAIRKYQWAINRVAPALPANANPAIWAEAIKALLLSDAVINAEEETKAARAARHRSGSLTRKAEYLSARLHISFDEARDALFAGDQA